MSQSSITEHYVAPHGEDIKFEELQDAPPSAKFKLSVTGWIGTIIVAFWFFIAIFGQALAPYGENDLPFPDDYSEFQAPRDGAMLGIATFFRASCTAPDAPLGSPSPRPSWLTSWALYLESGRRWPARGSI